MGAVVRVSSGEDVAAAAKLAALPGVVVMDATDWQSIPAESLVAAFAVRLPSPCSKTVQRGDAHGDTAVQARTGHQAAHRRLTARTLRIMCLVVPDTTDKVRADGGWQC